MNWPKRALTNTQQAPPATQSARLSPTKVAFRIAQLTSGGTILYRSHRQNRVRIVLKGEENRFWRSQASTPTLVLGRASEGAAS